MDDAAEHIAEAIRSRDDYDFRNLCNTIRPYVELVEDEIRLSERRYLLSKEASDRKSVLLLRDLVLEAQKAVDEKKARIRMIEASRNKLRPIR